jgi:hypothetical protein
MTVAASLEYPSMSISSEKLEEARAMVVHNRRIGIAEISKKLIVSQELFYSVVYDSLGIHKVHARLRQLTKEPYGHQFLSLGMLLQ